MVGLFKADGALAFQALKPGEGLDSIDGFCRGLNALDEYSDMASQILHMKFPKLGPIRVSCL